MRPLRLVAMVVARIQSPTVGKSSFLRLSALWSALIRSRATMQVFARVPKAAAPLKTSIGGCVLDDDLDAGARLEPVCLTLHGQWLGPRPSDRSPERLHSIGFVCRERQSC